MIATQGLQLVRGLWFVHKKQFLFAICGLFVCIVIARVAMTTTPNSPQWAAILGILLAMPCLFLLTSIFSYCDLMGCIEGPESTFPRFFARLPIASSVYVSTSVLGMCGSVVLWWGMIDYFVLSAAVRDVLPTALRNSWVLLVLPVLVLSSVLSLGYAMALTAFKRSWIRVAVSPFICTVPVILLAIGLENEWLPAVQMLVQAFIFLIALTTYQFCFHQGRHGVEMSFALPVRTRTQVSKELSIVPFRTAEASQFWFEWNRHGVGLLVATVPAVLLLEAFCTAWWYLSNAYSSRLLVCITMLAVALIMPVGVGASLGLGVLPLKSRFRDYIGMPVFYATRPILDLTIVKTLLYMTALSVVLGITISFAIALVFGSFSGANAFALFALDRAIDEYGFASIAGGAFLIASITFVVGFKLFAFNLLLNSTGKMWLWWLNFWGRSLAFVLASLQIPLWIEKPQPLVVDTFRLTTLLLFIVLLKWGVTLVLIRKVLDLDLCSFRQVRLGLQLWLLLVVSLSGLTCFVLRDFHVPALTITCSFAMLLPVNRLLGCVLVTHLFRHR